MCSRITSLLSAELLSATFGVPVAYDLKPRYNIAPTHQIPVIIEHPANERNLRSARWGQVCSWANDLSIETGSINTWFEHLAEKPGFSCASAHCRCIIPASGFYVWQRTDDNRKLPWYVTRKDRGPMAIAGLLEQWRTPAGTEIVTCTIITQPAYGMLRRLHDRVPAVLDAQDFPLWLASAEVSLRCLCSALRSPLPATLDTYSVSTLVNNPAYDSSDCIKPA